MGAHYMFLANMLHLDSIIYLHGSRKGVVRDAPLGFIVLATSDNTKTFIPAGGTVSHTTEVFHNFLWPLRLDVRLPVTTPAKRVRQFVQDMDRLLFWDPVVAIAPDGTAVVLDADGTSSFMDASPAHESVSTREFASAAATEMATRLLFDENRQEEERIIRRARGNEGFVVLEANKRWVVQFRTFVQATEKAHFCQTRAAVSVDVYPVTVFVYHNSLTHATRAILSAMHSTLRPLQSYWRNKEWSFGRKLLSLSLDVLTRIDAQSPALILLQRSPSG